MTDAGLFLLSLSTTAWDLFLFRYDAFVDTGKRKNTHFVKIVYSAHPINLSKLVYKNSPNMSQLVPGRLGVADKT